MAKSKVLVLFTSKTGNLANFIATYFSALKPILIHPDDNLDDVYQQLFQFKGKKKLFGMSVGYTKLIPKNIIDLFRGQLYNIHPGELPLTRGMYGDHVIYKMIDSCRLIGVITIHKVDKEQYDTGAIVQTTSFPFLMDITDLQTVYRYSQDIIPMPLDYLSELSKDYTNMLKLIEPTVAIKFIEPFFQT